jgi:hypothetical protein
MSNQRSIQPSMPVATPPHSKMAVSIWPLGILLAIVALLNLIASSHLTATWWANFIFVPAVVLLASARLLWSHTVGYWRISVHLFLSLGAIVFTVATILLFNVIWFGWTLLLIVPSLALVGHSMALTRMTEAPGLRAWLRAISWSGVATSLLGLIFLLMRLNILPMQQLVGDFQWWSGIIILAGIGELWNAWWLYRREHGRLTPAAFVLGGLGALTCIMGLLEAANIIW